jgi:hypothetical protein
MDSGGSSGEETGVAGMSGAIALEKIDPIGMKRRTKSMGNFIDYRLETAARGAHAPHCRNLTDHD